ncbi:hypothetical protein [Metabacillus sp. cB07]|uniref:hypothetical protein n=1 Tax=Metabacillus sp. cB07 TaxID=2806989 RepID=UPI001939EB26|nr:hypothetical protein [Metabacillus sp. cB07]
MKNGQAAAKQETNKLLAFLDGEGFECVHKQMIACLQTLMVYGCFPFFIYVLISFFN